MPTDSDQQSCLELHEKRGGVTIGCRACAHAQADTALGKGESICFKASNLLRHGSSLEHLKNELLLLGHSLSLCLEKSAPSQDDFRAVCQGRVSGKSLALEEGVGTDKKLRAMCWCLAEAKREMLRQAAASALCATLVQDGRHERLFQTSETVKPHYGHHPWECRPCQGMLWWT